MDFDFVMALFSLPGQDSLDVRAEIMGSRRFGISVDARICSVVPKAPLISSRRQKWMGVTKCTVFELDMSLGWLGQISFT